MKYSEARFGRVFVIRLEDGDIVHDSIQALAAEKHIKAGALVILGGADSGSRFVVGPEEDRSPVVNPLTHIIEHACEVAGVGTLFPDENNNPTLHMHMACGREGETITGCVRTGVKVWHVMEAILFELTDTDAVRKYHKATGFALLSP